MIKQEKIGLMCGTFNPPHIGHLILAQTAFQLLGLDRVLFLPVGDPTHKSTGTRLTDRLEMTKLVIMGNENFELDTTDAYREGPHYTSTLLPLLKEKFRDGRFWLLIGSDSLITFPQWHEPTHLLNDCRLAVLNRPGYKPDMAELAQSIPELPNRTDFLDGPTIHLSSSWLRQNIPTTSSMTYLLPAEVEQYAREQRLYE